MTNTKQNWSSNNFYQIHFFVFGKVQGIGFRNFVKRKGRKLALSGRVRNRINGSVEVVTVGKKKNIDLLLKSIEPPGPKWADVKKIEIISQKRIKRDPFSGTFEKSLSQEAIPLIPSTG